jgi:hypothetical protein
MHKAALARTVAVLVIVLALSGCFRARIELTVGPDQRVDGSLLLAYDRAVLEQIDRTPTDAQVEILDDMTDDAPRGQECTPWEDDAFVGAECRLEGVTLDDLGQAEAFDQRLTFVETDDELLLTAVIDLDEVPTDSPEPLETFDVTISITFPGRVTETNGEVDGTTVTWRAEPGERTHLSAVAALASPAEPAEIPSWLIGLVVLVVIGIVGIIVADRGPQPPPWRRDRRESEPT